MESIKYFIYQISRKNQTLPYIPIELRMMIWEKYFPYPFLICKICNSVIITLDINQKLINQQTNFKIINGLGYCNNH